MNRFLLLLFALPLVLHAEPGPAQADLLQQAQSAYSKGEIDQALIFLDACIKQSPDSPKGYLARAAVHDATRHYDKSLPDYDKALALDPKLTQAYQRRGMANFMLARIKESITDFDTYLESHPDEKPQHWQRGIALYYAGRYEDGAKQFELHRTVNPEDVENAAWHFACLARWKTPAAAKADLIPIDNDSRVPMMKIHEMFAGKATPEEVLAAAIANHAPPPQLNAPTFLRPPLHRPL